MQRPFCVNNGRADIGCDFLEKFYPFFMEELGRVCYPIQRSGWEQIVNSVPALLTYDRLSD